MQKTNQNHKNFVKKINDESFINCNAEDNCLLICMEIQNCIITNFSVETKDRDLIIQSKMLGVSQNRAFFGLLKTEPGILFITLKVTNIFY